MEMELSPKFPRTFFESEAGGYYNWSSADSSILSEAKVAAGKFVLKPQGSALPHYSDCSKIGYVLQGVCTVGLVSLNKKDKMSFVYLKKGDIIGSPQGSVSWWYNHGDSDFAIVFLAETSKAHLPGEITYFLLTGPIGYLSAFSPEFIAKTYRINQEQAQTLSGSQQDAMLIKLGEEQAKSIPLPHDQDALNKWTKNLDRSLPGVDVKKGGKSTTLTGGEFLLLEEIGLSANRLELEANAIRTPNYATDTQVFYVVKGSGKVQIFGLNGKLVLDTEVETDQLFVVPRFLMVSLLAGGEGMECFSVLTSARHDIGELAGKDSVLNTIPSFLQVVLNLTPEFTQVFKQMQETGTVIVPPMN
ncbi:11-S seed storage protein, plant [Corchorus capsularis]|uniref:11-S seed storage protein, plant n=1 Tax=Corchorus capsularis TaxID=210143 RepID=A0A1R3JZ00_COCAP|nr:11-S seed storage protein, plant [Corchorus capsularis]